MKERRLGSGTLTAVALALLLLPGLVAPGGAGAQEPAEEAAVEQMSQEDLERFARVHVAIEEVRDQLHEEMARWHEEHRRAEVREDADERIREVLAEHDVTAEQYEEFTRIVSIDEEHRAAFEEVLAELDPDL